MEDSRRESKFVFVPPTGSISNKCHSSPTFYEYWNWPGIFLSNSVIQLKCYEPKYCMLHTNTDYLNEGTGEAWASQVKLISELSDLCNFDPSFSSENFGGDPPMGSKLFQCYSCH